MHKKLESTENDHIWRPATDEARSDQAKSKPVFTRKEWGVIQEAVAKQFRCRLPLTNYLLKSGSTFTPSPEFEQDVIAQEEQGEGTNGEVVCLQRVTPLPITHCDVVIADVKKPETTYPYTVTNEDGTARHGIGTTPTLDTVLLEAATRRIADLQEQIVLGINDPFKLKVDGECEYVYGLMNFLDSPHVNGKLEIPNKFQLDNPQVEGWKNQRLISNLLGMRQLARNKKYFGPFAMIHGESWDNILNSDYILHPTAGPVTTTREKIRCIEGVHEDCPIKSLVFPKDDQRIVLFQYTPDVIRLVSVIKPTVVQWDDNTLRVLMCVVPQVRADCYGSTGIFLGEMAKLK